MGGEGGCLKMEILMKGSMFKDLNMGGGYINGGMGRFFKVYLSVEKGSIIFVVQAKVKANRNS